MEDERNKNGKRENKTEEENDYSWDMNPTPEFQILLVIRISFSILFILP